MAKHNPQTLLHLLFAIPNGGKRDAATAARLKAEGVKAGVPDICFPVPWHGFAGLYIELKQADDGRLSDAQKQWADDLRAVGYAVVTAWGYEAAKTAVLDYLAGRLQSRQEYRKVS